MKTKVEDSRTPQLHSTDAYATLIIQYSHEVTSPMIPLASWPSYLKGMKAIPLGEGSDRQILYVRCTSEPDFSLILQTIRELLQDSLLQATWIPVSGAYRICGNESGREVEACPLSAIPS